nr:protein DpdD [Nocardia sp. 348MFTsu5.1]
MTEPTSVFFTSPNEIIPSRLTGDMAQLLDMLRRRLDRLESRTMLPARVSGTTRWYGVAPTQRDGRVFREEMRCWFARPLTAGQAIVPHNSSDPIDQLALGLVPDGAVLRVDVAHGWTERVRQNVISLHDVWSLTPDRGVDQPRPVGRILRQFYESLIGDDRAGGEAALDELRGRALLSATNLRFLRIELLSSLGTPQELRDEPSLKGISLLVRPPAVTENLAKAADTLLLGATADFSDDEILRSAATRLDLVWPSLVTDTHQVTTAATARCYALGQLLVRSPHERHLGQILASYPDDPVIAGVVTATRTSGAPVQQALTPSGLYYAGEYESALELAYTELPNRSTAAIALAAAVNLQDSPSAAKALAVVERLADSERAGLLDSVVERLFFEQLQALTSDDRVPSDWLDWLANDWPDRPDLLFEWSRHWSRTADDLTATSDELAGMLIDALNDARRPRVRNGVPVFVEWLIAGGIPSSGVALAATIFDIMLSSEPGRSERQAALSLLEGVLDVGCSTEEYREVLDAISRELSVIGPRDGQWLAQVVDLLLAYAAPDPVERSSLIARASGVVHSWNDMIDHKDAILLGLLFRGAGIVSNFPEPEVVPDSDVRSFTSVGVYSLKENSIRVVRSWIEARWPGVTVKHSSSEVNSKSLVSLVQGVDVMLVQTSHATHAATGAINTAVVDSSRLVLVNGRGATSLMRALLDWAGAN